MVHLPKWRPVQSFVRIRPLFRFVFGFGNRVPETMPDSTRQGTTCSLVRRVVYIHRGVAGITEDGSCYAHPNTFRRAERDGEIQLVIISHCLLCCMSPSPSVA